MPARRDRPRATRPAPAPRSASAAASISDDRPQRRQPAATAASTLASCAGGRHDDEASRSLSRRMNATCSAESVGIDRHRDRARGRESRSRRRASPAGSRRAARRDRRGAMPSVDSPRLTSRTRSTSSRPLMRDDALAVAAAEQVWPWEPARREERQLGDRRGTVASGRVGHVDRLRVDDSSTGGGLPLRPPRFSRRRIGPMTIARSTALSMS